MMATNAVLTFSQGKVEVPSDLQRQLELQDGDAVRVMRVPDLSWVSQQAEDGSIPDWAWNPRADWRSIHASLSGNFKQDTTAARAAERALELKDDRRTLGASPKRDA